MAAAVVVVVVYLAVGVVAGIPSGKVIELTEANFDEQASVLSRGGYLYVALPSCRFAK